VFAQDGSVKVSIRGELGSGTVLAIAIVALSVGCLAVTQAIAINLISETRLNAIADSAAVSADDALRGLITGYPCEVAQAIADENVAILDECRIVGFEAFVKLHVQSMGIVLNASARAGPSN
jgi:secretion/DNA translocation related TadE-like protein